jgi:hypothetical protein
MSIDPQTNFKEILKELFQLDKSDLDFGITGSSMKNTVKLPDLLMRFFRKLFNV